jgi:hypothetical protein
MKFALLLVGLTLGVATSACAQQSSPAISSATNPVAAQTPTLSPVYTDGKCHFRLKTVPGQGYADKGYMFYANGTDNPVGWGFGFGCNAGASQDDVYDQIGAKPVNGQWIDLDFNEPFKPMQKFKLIEFAGKNWKGIGTAVDQIYYADADRRSRFFNFCLVENNGPQVLCGRTQIRGVTQPPSASRLPKIMAVLKTIEFVDAPAQPQAPGSASSVH